MSWEQAPPPSRRARQWLWPGLVGVALITVVTLVLVARSDEQTGTLTIGPTAGPTGQATGAPSVNPSDFAPTPLEPLDGSTEDAGDGPLLPGGPDVTVVAADDRELRSINITTGDVHRSPVGTQVDPWTLFAVRDGVIANSANSVVLITSPDHQRVRLARNHIALPTLDANAVWVLEQRRGLSANTALRVGFDGTIGSRVAFPAIAQPQAGVGDSVFVWTPSGIHAVSGDGIRRITSSGLLAAVSTDRVAWFDCAADLTCQIVVGTHDDPDQVRTPVAASELPAGFFGFTLGKFSPDGRRLALPLFRVEQAGERSAIVIIDTTTGAELIRLSQQEGPVDGTPLDWSPDSQWLFVAASGRLAAWNVTTGELTELDDTSSGPIRGLAVTANP